jgi:hypothetical protein
MGVPCAGLSRGGGGRRASAPLTDGCCREGPAHAGQGSAAVRRRPVGLVRGALSHGGRGEERGCAPRGLVAPLPGGTGAQGYSRGCCRVPGLRIRATGGRPSGAGLRGFPYAGPRYGGDGSEAVPRQPVGTGRRAPQVPAPPRGRRPLRQSCGPTLVRRRRRGGRGRRLLETNGIGRWPPPGPVTCGRRCPGRRWSRGRRRSQVPTPRQPCSVSGAGGRSGRWPRAPCSARSGGRAGPG